MFVKPTGVSFFWYLMRLAEFFSNTGTGSYRCFDEQEYFAV
jgi:hypothetical protein